MGMSVRKISSFERNVRYLVFSLLLTTSVAVPYRAAANDGIPPEIYELVQRESEVVIGLKIHDQAGEPDLNMAYRIDRGNAEGTKVAMEEHKFTPSEAHSSETSCRIQDWDEEEELDCETDPSVCADCDGDGENECPVQNALAYCSDTYFFEIIDSCPPPGETTYELWAPQWYEELIDSKSIAISDTGEECDIDTDNGVDAGVDAGENTDEEGNSNGAGCTVAGIVGVQSPTGLLHFLCAICAGLLLRRFCLHR